MRILKIIALGVGSLVALLVLAALGVWLFVNPNTYKDRIIQQVRSATGRELALPGAIKLSVFPWVALQLGPASLGNPSGFPAGEFLSVGHAALRVKLLPLLHKDLQIGRIEIDQLNLHLLTNADGKGNWEDFGNHGSASANSSAADSGQSGSIFHSLAGIVISHSRVTYNALSVTDLNLDIGNVARKASVPVKLSFTLDRGANASVVSVAATLMASLDMAARHYGLSDLSLVGELKSRTGAAALPFKFSAPAVDLDLAAQTLRAPRFAAEFAAARLTGSLNGDQVIAKPVLAGAVSLAPVALRAFMTQLGIDLPSTRDAQAFSRLSLKTDFRYADHGVSLQNLDAQLDDSHLNGSVAVTDFDSKATRFALNLDHIDIDRYRSPAGQPTGQAPGEPAPLPGSALKPLDVQGSFLIGGAKISGLSVSNVKVNLQAKGGLIQLAPLGATLYGGQYSGNITYDVRGAVPQLQLDQRLTGVDVAPLLKDAIDSQRLSGRGNVSATLAGHGLDSDALLKSLSGRMQMNLANGAIEGADLTYEIGVAQALLKRQPLPATANTRRTRFDALKMTATITDGVAKTDDLLIGTPYLRVTGLGTTNLLSKAVDLHLVATVLKAPPDSQGAGLSQLTLAAIPVTVTGTVSDPKVRPDLQGLIKSQLQQKARDIIRNKLGDKLKGLFGTH